MHSIEIDAPVDEVFAQWSRCENFPHLMDSVRRVKRIDERRSLWDVDIAGRQFVWEARIVEQVPGKLVRWQSSWGASNAGQVGFEALPDDRTRLRVEIEFVPRSLLERLGARLGLADVHLRFDLTRFGQFVEEVGGHQKPA